MYQIQEEFSILLTVPARGFEVGGVYRSYDSPSNTNRNGTMNFVRGYDVGVFASTVVANSTNAKAVIAGTLAHNHVKPITARVTNEIAGVANTALLRGDNKVNNSIHKTEEVRTAQTSTSFRDGCFNLFTGKFNPYYWPDPSVPKLRIISQTDSFGSDNASSPTNGVRGRVTYQTGRSKSV